MVMFHRGNGIRRASRVERPVFPLPQSEESKDNKKVITTKNSDPNNTEDHSNSKRELKRAFSSAWTLGSKLLDSGKDHSLSSLPCIDCSPVPQGQLIVSEQLNPLLTHLRHSQTLPPREEDSLGYFPCPTTPTVSYIRDHSSLTNHDQEFEDCSVLEFSERHLINENRSLLTEDYRSNYGMELTRSTNTHDYDDSNSDCSSCCNCTSSMDTIVTTTSNENILSTPSIIEPKTCTCDLSVATVPLSVTTVPPSVTTVPPSVTTVQPYVTTPVTTVPPPSTGVMLDCLKVPSVSFLPRCRHPLSAVSQCDLVSSSFVSSRSSYCEPLKRSRSLSTIKISPYQVYDGSSSSTVGSSCNSPEATASFLRSFGSMELLTAAAIDEIAEYSLYSNQSPDGEPPPTPPHVTTYSSPPPTPPDCSSVSAEYSLSMNEESVDGHDSFIQCLMIRVRPASANMSSPITIMHPSSISPPPRSDPIDLPSPDKVDSLAPPTEVPPVIPKRTSSLFPSKSRLPDKELIQQAKRLSAMLNITHEPSPSKRSLKTTFNKILRTRKTSVPVMSRSLPLNATGNSPHNAFT